MPLDFDSIVYIANRLKQEKSGKSLPDSEIMALYCIWFKLSYADFIEDQEKYISEYAYLYEKPNNLKKISTLPPCANRVLELFRAKYPIGKTRKNHFRRKIIDLYQSKNSSVYEDFEKFLKEDDKRGLETHVPDTSSASVFKELSEHKYTAKGKDGSLDTNLRRDIPSKIPRNHESIIGRERDYHEIFNLIKDKPVILIHGFYGVGKTFFLQKMKSLVEHEYNYFYTDFKAVNSLEEWIIRVLAWSGQEYDIDSLSLTKTFLNYLENNQCLLIIDSVGKFGNDFNYFIESFAINSNSKSRIIISSSFKINLNLPEDYIGRYELCGLKEKDDIFNYIGYLGLKDKECWEELSNKYSGNFRELSYVAKFIRDFFNGHVSEYLKTNTDLMSSDLYSIFSSTNFLEIDLKIFSTFFDNESGLSKKLLQLLKGESSSGEIFNRIQYLCDQGYLICSRNEETQFVNYSLFPLLKKFLVQEDLIDV